MNEKPPATHSQLLDIAQRACMQAGAAVLDHYQAQDFTAYTKDDASPVTSADYLANEIIQNVLQRGTPNIPIMSEESALLPLKQRQDWARYWLIDPIDGTQEFIAGSGDFAVNIALIEQNTPILGCIYWPCQMTMYFARKGYGAYKSTPCGEQKISINRLLAPDTDALTLAVSRRQVPFWVKNKLDHSRRYESVALGSCSLKTCLIAEGKADFYVRVGETGEWDTGASQCILHEAGGRITALDFQPLSYNRREILTNPNFVAMGDPAVDWHSVIVTV